ncbi:response regulator transcription factor [Paenibacillus eucommiae]|nr:response regulator transcription factor [Paenibacillus eucommiae]
MKSKIWIVEDELEIRHILLASLSGQGFIPSAFDSGPAILEAFESDQPNLVLLDVQLPDMDGFEICRRIRSFSNVPILFVSCLDDGTDIVQGLDLGGDDYITKPFDLNQLIARIKSNLRRAPLYIRDDRSHSSEYEAAAASSPGLPRKIRIGRLELDYNLQKASIDHVNLPLSQKEFQILSLLAFHSDQTFSANEIYSMIWGTDSLGETRTLKVHISHLRKKLEDSGQKAGTILNIRGLGYQYRASL